MSLDLDFGSGDRTLNVFLDSTPYSSTYYIHRDTMA
jgi:hypothetical protein